MYKGMFFVGPRQRHAADHDEEQEREDAAKKRKDSCRGCLSVLDDDLPQPQILAHAGGSWSYNCLTACLCTCCVGAMIMMYICVYSILYFILQILRDDGTGRLAHHLVWAFSGLKLESVSFLPLPLSSPPCSGLFSLLSTLPLRPLSRPPLLPQGLPSLLLLYLHLQLAPSVSFPRKSTI